MFVVLSLTKIVGVVDLDSKAKQKVVKKFYCKTKFKAILQEMGEALEKFENYKALSGERYYCKVEECDDRVTRVNIITTEIDILDYREQYKIFLEEAKIADARKCLCT